jgi:hypothetical protein
MESPAATGILRLLGTGGYPVPGIAAETQCIETR